MDGVQLLLLPLENSSLNCAAPKGALHLQMEHAKLVSKETNEEAPEYKYHHFICFPLLHSKPFAVGRSIAGLVADQIALLMGESLRWVTLKAFFSGLEVV